MRKLRQTGVTTLAITDSNPNRYYPCRNYLVKIAGHEQGWWRSLPSMGEGDLPINVCLPQSCWLFIKSHVVFFPGIQWVISQPPLQSGVAKGLGQPMVHEWNDVHHFSAWLMDTSHMTLHVLPLCPTRSRGFWALGTAPKDGIGCESLYTWRTATCHPETPTSNYYMSKKYISLELSHLMLLRRMLSHLS